MHQYETWEDAYRAGYRLVIRANRLGGDVADDIALGRLAGKALLLDLSEDWVYSMLEVEREHEIEKLINRRLH